MFGTGFLSNRRFNRAIGGAYRRFILQIEFYSANIRLVCDGFRKNFQHYGKPEFRCERGCSIFAAGNVRLNRGNAVDGEQLLRLDFCQQQAAGVPRALDNLFDLRAGAFVKLGIFRERGSFVEPAQVIGLAPHVGESPSGSIRKRESWNTRGIQGGFTRGDAIASHPTGEDRLAIFFGVGFETFGNVERISHPLRSKDDEQSITIWILRSDFESAGVTLRLSVAKHVYGIVVAPVRGKELVEPIHASCGELSQFAAIGDKCVGGENSRTASIGQDGETRTFRRGLPAEHLRHVKKVCDVVNAQHTAAAKCRIQYFIASGERPGVRSCSAGSGLGPASLYDDDGFRKSNLAGSGQKRAGIYHRLHVEQNALGMRIVAEVVDQISPTHIEHGTRGNDCAEPNLLAMAPVEDGAQQRSALT